MNEDCFVSYSDANSVKADFNDIYQRSDPRLYHKVLGGLDYVIPEIAKPVLLQLAEHVVAERNRPIIVLDVGCSYGVNAALMRHGVSLRQLRDRYTAPAIATLPAWEVAVYDARYFASWPARRDIRFIGLDTSAEAIAYANNAGLLERGIAADLEAGPLEDRVSALVGVADLIISTGCVGYVTQATFARLLDAMPGPTKPMVASLVLRMFDYEPIAATLAEHGLVTEKFPSATFVQRRFRDREEFEQTLALLDARGIDPAGKEAEGLFHAELFVSRPAKAVAAVALTDLVSISSGIGRSYGDRHRRPDADGGIAA